MKHKINGKLYAMKIIHKAYMEKERKEYQVNAEREVLVMTNSPNIIKLYYTFKDSERLYFALEYAPNGDLHELIRVAKTLSFPLAQYYAAEIVNILEYLHLRGVVHQDLKPENILLSEDWHLKLADFGTAKFLYKESGCEDFVGTAEYVSPEVLMNKKSTAASDLWGLGCIIYELFVGRTLFERETEYWTFEAITNGDYNFPEDMNADATALCKLLLIVEPTERLGSGNKGTPLDYAALKGHKFFEGIDFQKLAEMNPPIDEELIEKVKARRLKKEKRKKELKAITYAIKQEIILKRCGWLFYKKRKLVLTVESLLSYYDPNTGEHRGDISLEKDVKAVKVEGRKFNVITTNRVYYFKGTTEESANEWVRAINSSIPI
jgi:3-phosphoinositide dependent protein kinase-1